MEIGNDATIGAALKKLFLGHLVDLEKGPSNVKVKLEQDATEAAATPTPIAKPLYLPFRRDLKAENGGLDSTLLEGEYTPRAKKVQKEEFGKCFRIFCLVTLPAHT
jgi:hypothetical protein